jgi:hypothetical protein
MQLTAKQQLAVIPLVKDLVKHHNTVKIVVKPTMSFLSEGYDFRMWARKGHRRWEIINIEVSDEYMRSIVVGRYR